MSEASELASLPVGRLRQLAGEHHIPNRSRLGKDELITALTDVLGERASQLAAPSPDAPPAAGDGSAAQTQMQLAPAPVAPATAEAAPAVSAAPSTPTPAAVVSSEPEEITLSADLVAAAAAPSAIPSATPSAAGNAQANSADLAANESDANGAQGAAQIPGGEGEHRRRRRRRRGRGRGRGPDAQHQPGGVHDAQGDHEDDEDSDEDPSNAAAPAVPAPGQAIAPAIATAAATPAPSSSATPSAAPVPASRTQPTSAAPATPSPRPAARPPQSESQRPPQSESQRPPQAQPSPAAMPDARAPRPRLEGPMVPMPGVLDRLKRFTVGILDLCSPDTPSWAQPRLAELLAESGVVPTPTRGEAHPDFHEVVGEQINAAVQPGHISVVVAPGFSLRGDRGDLFPVRKAKVKVAPGGVKRVAPASPASSASMAPSAAPSSAIAATPPAAPVAAADATAIAQPAASEPIAAGVATQPQSPRPVQPPRPVQAPRPAQQHAPRPPARPQPAPSDSQAPTSTNDGEPEAIVVGDASSAPNPIAPAPTAPAPRPAQGRPPERIHPREAADDAPTLPLASQATDELALRPKSEGFRALGLNDQLLADLAAIGFTAPSPIQEAAIPPALAGKDLIGQAQTGTGKTAAFALPILQKLYALEGEGPVALVLCPTRELARQVHTEILRMAGKSGARATCIYGGVPMEDQFRALSRKPHIVVGTPGRVIDHVKRHTLDLSRLAVAVLDEADQMLDIGFWPDVTWIIKHTPPSRQTLLFSATFPEPIRVMAETQMRAPEHIAIAPKQVTVEHVDQKYIAVAHNRKMDLLAHFIQEHQPPQLVVFCRTKHQTDRVGEVLKKRGLSAGAIHGDLPQSRRERILADFRAGTLQSLIATNVAARGLDIPTVSHVVNYDVPEQPEEYVHRIGRTARNGAKGIARTFITSEDGQFLSEIEKHIGLLLEEEKVEGFTQEQPTEQQRPALIEANAVSGKLLKPLARGIRLGRRR